MGVEVLKVTCWVVSVSTSLVIGVYVLGYCVTVVYLCMYSTYEPGVTTKLQIAH